jgi:cytochrome c oxidase subunit IV
MTATAPTESEARAEHLHADQHEHPKDRQYIAIALVLAVVTAIEVALSYVHLGEANNPLLLLGMVIKFALVASFFMHLKFDNKVLRRFLVTGLVLAVFCYIGMLSMFRQFDKDTKQEIRYTPSGIRTS